MVFRAVPCSPHFPRSRTANTTRQFWEVGVGGPTLRCMSISPVPQLRVSPFPVFVFLNASFINIFIQILIHIFSETKVIMK